MVLCWLGQSNIPILGVGSDMPSHVIHLFRRSYWGDLLNFGGYFRRIWCSRLIMLFVMNAFIDGMGGVGLLFY